MAARLQFFFNENKIKFNPDAVEKKSYRNLKLSSQTARVNPNYFGRKRQDCLAIYTKEEKVSFCLIESLWEFGDEHQMVETVYARWFDKQPKEKIGYTYLKITSKYDFVGV